jgi:hypothetical protein
MSSELEWHGDEVLAIIRAAAAHGLGDATDQIAQTSQDRVPYQTRELMRSQHVVKDDLHTEIYYTDSKAAAAHENIHGRVYRRGRRAKFLESAADDHREDTVRSVAEEIRRVL